jgi:hypothetical protein
MSEPESLNVVEEARPSRVAANALAACRAPVATSVTNVHAAPAAVYLATVSLPETTDAAVSRP